jgi:hypothetical protein
VFFIQPLGHQCIFDGHLGFGDFFEVQRMYEEIQSLGTDIPICRDLESLRSSPQE